MKVSLVIILVLLFSACNKEEKNLEDQVSESAKEITQALQIDTQVKKTEEPINNESKELVDFTYQDLEGNEVKLSDYRGKWVVVNFWATWCPPCRKEIPDFVKFKSLYSDNVEVLGIGNEDAEIEVIRKFAEDYSINYPILMADIYNPTDFEKENTMGLPTTVIFDPKGIEFSKRVGPIHFADLVDIIDIEPNIPTITKELKEKSE